MSLMTVRSESADVRTMSRYSRCSGVRSVSRASSVMPTMPFIGVRISWLMLARNSLFARFATSARSFAATRSAVRAFTSASAPSRAVTTDAVRDLDMDCDSRRSTTIESGGDDEGEDPARGLQPSGAREGLVHGHAGAGAHGGQRLDEIVVLLLHELQRGKQRVGRTAGDEERAGRARQRVVRRELAAQPRDFGVADGRIARRCRAAPRRRLRLRSSAAAKRSVSAAATASCSSRWRRHRVTSRERVVCISG